MGFPKICSKKKSCLAIFTFTNFLFTAPHATRKILKFVKEVKNLMLPIVKGSGTSILSIVK